MSDALITPCGLYRYWLSRRWIGLSKTMAFVMLNPSTADAAEDDPTIRRCIGFAGREGCSRLYVVNLFAWRGKDPQLIGTKGVDPVGPENDRWIKEIVGHADIIVAAWGSHGDRFSARVRDVLGIIAKASRPVFCLGKTSSGQPRHPLYLKRDQPLEPYAA